MRTHPYVARARFRRLTWHALANCKAKNSLQRSLRSGPSPGTGVKKPEGLGSSLFSGLTTLQDQSRFAAAVSHGAQIFGNAHPSCSMIAFMMRSSSVAFCK